MGTSEIPILPAPPPYSRVRQRRRYPRVLNIPLPILTLICFIVSLQFFLVPRYFGNSSEKPGKIQLNQHYVKRFDTGLAKCRNLQTPPVEYDIEGMLQGKSQRQNQRWNAASGQQVDIFLKNATLFDGESWSDTPMNILFHRGTITAISPTSPTQLQSIPDVEAESFIEVDLQGKYVTPGLVDMHSHHYIMNWPGDVFGSDDTNEMHKDTGPLTPFVRVLDGLKTDDLATALIASGGVTSSLILPGSGNIMGGEGIPVKNIRNSGEHGEGIVEDILLEHGVDVSERRKYMKMACGENPMRVYGAELNGDSIRTRMGNAWKLRQHLERTRDLVSKQDEWCLAAASAKESGNEVEMIEKRGDLPEELELESSVAMLRGQTNINMHCYEPQDMEDMILHAHEFGFRVSAFHHALGAWKVPELIKNSGMNITIATFAEFGLLKKEAYGSNLWAGSILAEHGVPLAYKSDHSIPELSAKYLLHQAATAHSFHLPENIALQAVTSVPAKSIGQDHRIGYIRVGYDADIVVWDSHPLSVGATPLQVYIDGKSTLDPNKVQESMSGSIAGITRESRGGKPEMKARVTAAVKEDLCSRVEKADQQVIIKGIAKSYLETDSQNLNEADSTEQNLTMILTNNKITCFGSDSSCSPQVASTNPTIITLKNGHVLPGLTALTMTMGIAEMVTADATTDGALNLKLDPLKPENVVYAKYGLHLQGVTFDRARIGGVTRAITPPLFIGEPDAPGFLNGVSVGFKTGGERKSLDRNIFQDDVGLHFTVGQSSKATEATPTISTAVAKLRQILSDNKGKDNVYGKARKGSIPLIVHADNKYDIMQLIKIKRDYQDINLVIYGGSSAYLVAKELAEARIPVILTTNRGGPDSWERLEALPGPPLSRSPAAMLSEAGVEFGLAIMSLGDTHIHNLIIEASWAAKYAGLSDHEAINLVSRNIEKILDLPHARKSDSERDFVVWEGDPLDFGASVVLAVDGEKGEIMDCWPEAV